MEEIAKMVLVHRTRKGWRVFHAQNQGGGQMIRDVYLEEDGQIPPYVQVIQATISTDEESGGIALFLSSTMGKSAQYKPIIATGPTTKPEILVMYVNRRPDLPPKLFLAIEPAGVERQRTEADRFFDNDREGDQ